ncbi:hypothetical protein HYALB_00009486 [Hymenoscyphus albidus]|uniref:Uncharacterized protein n=1 Tax=Hymenoscyphus albidus TaxID=595503 RepID=A0A9N9M054_9HELO|nr:hypothetical protein HYALB_00009486 [Hymenoscyphus albidus]
MLQTPNFPSPTGPTPTPVSSTAYPPVKRIFSTNSRPSITNVCHGGPLIPDGGPTSIPNASITYDEPKPSEAPSRGFISLSVVLVVGLAFAGLMV